MQISLVWPLWREGDGTLQKKKGGNIRTSREEHLIAWRSIWKHWGDILISKLIGCAIELNSASVAYISVLLKMLCCWRCWTFQPLACCVSIPLWLKLNKMQKSGSLKQEHQCYWFAKFNYLEKRWFVQIAKFKCCEIILFQICEIIVSRE